MNIAIILAGGSGNRMGQNIPKQFIVEFTFRR
jgi:2-C-methyl-D-erythritol 4-phosphate cytidylyltransferase